MTTLFNFQDNQTYYSCDIFNHTEDMSSVSVYNQRLNYGEAFAYLYRRFGDSPEKRDSYKDLAVYYLSTPLESVVLVVSPHHESYPFNYLVDADTRKKLYQEQKIIRDEFEERFDTWCKENNRIVFSKYNWGNTPEQLEYLRSWLTSNDIKGFEDNNIELPKELSDKFLDEIQNEFMTVRRYYFDNVEDLTAGDFCKQVKSALMVTIKDLLTPVNIRDWQINILGKI